MNDDNFSTRVGQTTQRLSDFLRSAEDLNVGLLRKRHPEWAWRAVRHGLGWRYEGHRGEQRVTIQAFASHYGPLEDDTAVQWRVYETDETYTAWACRNG